MGHKNQLFYLEKMLPDFEGDVLEIGSKDYGNTQDFRSLYPDNLYLGLDIEPGGEVDIVHDLETGPLDQTFDLIICCSVLEHVPRPWVVADHIMQMLNSNGKLYISVPWVQRYHPYPEDYYRFSFPGIKALFPDIQWEDAKLSTFVHGEFANLIETPDIDSAGQQLINNRAMLPCFEVHALGTK